jgi:hypothetical protein
VAVTLDLLGIIDRLKRHWHRAVPEAMEDLAKLDARLEPVRAELVADPASEKLLIELVEAAHLTGLWAVDLQDHQTHVDAKADRGQVVESAERLSRWGDDMERRTRALLTGCQGLLAEMGQPIG